MGSTTTEGAVLFEEMIAANVEDGVLTYEAVYTTVVPGYTITGSATLKEDGTADGTGYGVDPRGAEQDFSIVVSKMNPLCL